MPRSKKTSPRAQVEEPLGDDESSGNEDADDSPPISAPTGPVVSGPITAILASDDEGSTDEGEGDAPPRGKRGELWTTRAPASEVSRWRGTAGLRRLWRAGPLALPGVWNLQKPEFGISDIHADIWHFGSFLQCSPTDQLFSITRGKTKIWRPVDSSERIEILIHDSDFL